jgi:hypothetical protein
MSDDTPPPPPPEESNASLPPSVPPPLPPAEELPLEDSTLGSGRRQLPFWSRFGGEGFIVSVGVHVVLVLIAAFLIISVTKESSKKDPNSFATGAGGGSAGDKAKNYETKIKPKNVKALAKNAARITSKSTTATISLPDLPTSSSASMISGMMAGGSSKGFGGGSGGGIGSGMGVGVGNGRNFVGRPVMGAKIFAQRIAVYMDASGSMTPYLERVEGEIRKQFPDADVYMYNGLFIYAQDGFVTGGKRFKGQPIRSFGTGARETDPKKLTGSGKNILKKYDDNFKQGSAGAWIDIMKDEKGYDALVLFSDFQDGVTQYRIKGEKADANVQGGGYPIVYYDGIRTDIARGAENRKPDEKRWEQEWLKAFNDARDGKGPRLYLFSTHIEPQELLTKCATGSGGQIKMVTWLRTGGQPPADPVDPANAGDKAISTDPAAAQPPAAKAYKPAR